MPPENGRPSALYTARPDIQIDGQAQPGLTAGLLALTIAEDIQGLYRCECTFGNWGPKDGSVGFLFMDRQLLEFGKRLVVKSGADVIFDGLILALEANFPEAEQPTISVLAEDRCQELRMTRRTRTFVDVSDADVFRQIASDHGLAANVDLSGPSYKVLAQVNQSDLAFLRERARSIEAELWIDGSALYAKARSGRRNEPLQLSLGRDVRDFTVLADLAQQRTAVTATGWDVGGKQALRHEATDTLVTGELNGGSGGAALLQRVMGARQEVIAHSVPLSSREAQAVAESYFKLQARRFLTGHGTADHNAKLRVGATVELQGLGPLFSGKYYVTQVIQRYDLVHGFRSDFYVERPDIGA